MCVPGCLPPTGISPLFFFFFKERTKRVEKIWILNCRHRAAGPDARGARDGPGGGGGGRPRDEGGGREGGESRRKISLLIVVAA